MPTPSTEPADVRLPVLPGTDRGRTVRRSRNAPRRAAVLVTIQLLMIGHLVLWLLSRHYGWWGGRTLAPVEPSESMEFVKSGVINMGLVFFVVALLGTLLLGRWFCGWGCHIIMMQDFCGWIMKRMGVHPKPFRSRLLVYVPLVLALYMFVWPAFYRLAIAPWTRPDLHWPGFEVHLTTTEFWRSMPGVLVAIPFLLICGFATVYFLGAKGFCTYGCPYGGFFAPVDELAVGRIRVTDACEQCGHCTAVCTSNVRVHEEVREYGMVVDPGCMKCTDCISVCPNDALYFGLGRPALAKGAARHRAPKPNYDLTLGEEFAMAAVFAGVFFAMRGVYGLVPLLMAAGIAGCVTFVTWKLWRLRRDPNVSFRGARLRFRGTLTGRGRLFLGLGTATLLLVAHCAVIRCMQRMAVHHDDRVTVRPAAVLTPLPAPLPEEIARHVDAALAWYGRVARMDEGGIGLFRYRGNAVRMAWLHVCRGEFSAAERSLRDAIDREGGSEQLHDSLIQIMRLQGREAEALAHHRDVVATEPMHVGLLESLIDRDAAEGRLDSAIALCEMGLEHHDGAARTRLQRRRTLLLINAGRPSEAIEILQTAIAADPEDRYGHAVLAEAYAAIGNLDAALDSMGAALAAGPPDPALLLQAAALHEQAGQPEEAARLRSEARG